jgi:hypothetical protein
MKWAIVRRNGNRVRIEYTRTLWGARRIKNRWDTQGEWTYIKITRLGQGAY